MRRSVRLPFPDLPVLQPLTKKHQILRCQFLTMPDLLLYVLDLPIVSSTSAREGVLDANDDQVVAAAEKNH